MELIHLEQLADSQSIGTANHCIDRKIYTYRRNEKYIYLRVTNTSSKELLSHVTLCRTKMAAVVF